MTRQGFIDVKCSYLPHFSTTLLSHVSVIETYSQPNQYISQGIQLFFASNEVVLDRNLKSNSVNLKSVDYNHDYGTCLLTCVHHHIELMSYLNFFPEEYHELPFHEYFAKNVPITALNKEAKVKLWHQSFIHCGSHCLKSASLYVDSVPNLSVFNFDYVLKCPTYLKTNLTKRFGKKSLREIIERPYQDLFIDFSFSRRVKRNIEGVVIKASRKGAEGMNGETTWILISNTQNI